ncbi:hypothetical protein [Actinopolymorpha alba]|uniref:hypothetical protein n=1 Tax=Actinopolymorpha alba TaxID=533267 RepID=UPI00035ED66E|nr:hypothetical protein [Actinopolymorpha alba]
MTHTRELLDSSALTLVPQVSSDRLAAAVDAMLECEEAVTACAAAMLAGDDALNLRDAIARDHNCADVVATTRRVLTRDGDVALLSAQLEACVIACEHSTQSCGKHAAHHEHCRICSEATQRCAEQCRQVIQGLHGANTRGK